MTTIGTRIRHNVTLYAESNEGLIESRHIGTDLTIAQAIAAAKKAAGRGAKIVREGRHLYADGHIGHAAITATA